uniref:Uncharacterized protein n=1 Tax=Steinernema glaseri TaxID=37863 RepID=A0A1I7YIY4_9BILA
MGWIQRNRPQLLVVAVFLGGFYFWNSRQTRHEAEYFVPSPQMASHSNAGNVTVMSPLIFIGEWVSFSLCFGPLETNSSIWEGGTSQF